MALISKVLANLFLDRGALCKQAQAGGRFLWEPSSHCGKASLAHRASQPLPQKVTEHIIHHAVLTEYP